MRLAAIVVATSSLHRFNDGRRAALSNRQPTRRNRRGPNGAESPFYTVVAPDPGVSLPWRYRAARLAESFLRDHRDRPVSLGELCALTGVPQRTLMLGFRDLFGLSPVAYHRRMRLCAARRDLVRGRPTDTSVTMVALRWGFDHFGRFSVDYRRMFGESPVTTLRG